MDKLRIATRKSRLAMWQSEHVAEGLRRAHPGLLVELVPMSTRGDEVLDRSLTEIGGKGLFLKELETALLEGLADIAVHSLKDVPAQSPPGVDLVAMLPRADWCDLWLQKDGLAPSDLVPGSRVGTSSLRRQSQLLRSFPHLTVVPVRGNVETRLGLMTAGKVDAVILAAAGIDRLALELPYRSRLEPPAFLPAPGQGVIVVQCRAEDQRIRDCLQAIHCDKTMRSVVAERAVVATLGGDCRMPLAALAEQVGEQLHVRARLASGDGRQCLDAELRGGIDQGAELGQLAARELLDKGGAEILEQL